MKIHVVIVFFIFLLASCGQENKPKLAYDEEGASPEVADSSGVLMSGLPVQIDSLSYLIHPVGKFRLYQTSGRYASWDPSGGSWGSGSYSVIDPSGRDTYTGDLYNLKFQHIDSDSLMPLTSKNIRIYSLTFLRQIFEDTGKDYLLYKVNDEDTNRDGKIDGQDLTTLYLSRSNGKEFTKLSPRAQEVIDWRNISVRNRIYFRSIEDTNRNGTFEEEDQLHYFYIDFNEEDLRPVEYYPL